jgi:hypothetical protein
MKAQKNSACETVKAIINRFVISALAAQWSEKQAKFAG